MRPHRPDHLVEILEAMAERLDRIEDVLTQLLDEETEMADDLQAGFDALSIKVQAAVDADVTAAAELKDLTDLLANVKPNTTLTGDQLASMSAKIDAATTALSAQASASAQATDQPAPDPAPAPPNPDPNPAPPNPNPAP